MINQDVINKIFSRKYPLKVIAGLDNFDIENVLAITEAANLGGVSLLDICSDNKIIRAVKKNTSLPICVSLTNFYLVEAAIESGADVIELGNFDSLYHRGIHFGPQDIIEMTRKLKDLYPMLILSVTIPHTLPVNQQINLAKNLEILGVNIIQTEASIINFNFNKNLNTEISRASSTLLSTYAISQVIKIPIFTSSNLSETSLSLPFSYGASGIGIGKAIAQLPSVVSMKRKINNINLALEYASENSHNSYTLSLSLGAVCF